MGECGTTRSSARIATSRLELLTALLLGLAGVATSWSGYQVVRWNGAMTAQYDSADANRLEATRAITHAGQLRMADVALFTNWLNAYAARDGTLAAFYRMRFRREFRPAFEAWIAARPLQNDSAPSSPFVMKEYQLVADDSAKFIEGVALHALQEAQSANRQSDAYALNTVLFATILFLAGTVGTFRSRRLRIAVVIMAGALFAAGVVRMIGLPVM